MIGRYLVRRRVADLASRALAPHALLARQAVESGGFTVGAGEAMSKHWSGVEMGHYFEVVINDYDPNIYTETSVTVPFYGSIAVSRQACPHACWRLWSSQSNPLPQILRIMSPRPSEIGLLHP